MKYFSLTAIGPDQPGIVSSITQFLFEKGCNIENSSMTQLQGQFAIILIASGEIKDNSVLTAWEKELQDETKYLGLNIALSPIAKLQTDSHKEKALVSIHGADRAGIVAKVSKFLYDQNINVSNLDTQLIHEPKPLYIMQIEIECSADHLKKINPDLEKLGKSLDVSIKVQPIREAVI
jgi:glycine cleavage system transcriptional repressor